MRGVKSLRLFSDLTVFSSSCVHQARCVRHPEVAKLVNWNSFKVLVFETNIPIQLAFYALLEHESAAAPLWDSTRREFVGLMTITDFVDILRHYHDEHGRTGAAIEVLASRSIAQVLNDADVGTHFKHATEAFDQSMQQQPSLLQGQIGNYSGLIAVDANGAFFSLAGVMMLT